MPKGNHRLWPKPRSRDFGELCDPEMYLEILEMARDDGRVSLKTLQSEDSGLRQRLRRLWWEEMPSQTKVEGALRALKSFEWLGENAGYYSLSQKGATVLESSQTDPKYFRRQLLTVMQQRYTVPGWLVARLFYLNPKGQGEIVLPSPQKQQREVFWRREWFRRG